MELRFDGGGLSIVAFRGLPGVDDGAGHGSVEVSREARSAARSRSMTLPMNVASAKSTCRYPASSSAVPSRPSRRRRSAAIRASSSGAKLGTRGNGAGGLEGMEREAKSIRHARSSSRIRPRVALARRTADRRRDASNWSHASTIAAAARATNSMAASSAESAPQTLRMRACVTERVWRFRTTARWPLSLQRPSHVA